MRIETEKSVLEFVVVEVDSQPEEKKLWQKDGGRNMGKAKIGIRVDSN
jgi:hypothetical protein